jgi:hypothetical protein
MSGQGSVVIAIVVIVVLGLGVLMASALGERTSYHPRCQDSFSILPAHHLLGSEVSMCREEPAIWPRGK